MEKKILWISALFSNHSFSTVVIIKSKVSSVTFPKIIFVSYLQGLDQNQFPPHLKNVVNKYYSFEKTNMSCHSQETVYMSGSITKNNNIVC